MRGTTHRQLLRAKMPFSKFSARAGLKIPLESNCPPLIRKRVIAHQIPRSVFRGMRRLAGIVIPEPPPKVTGLPDIPFIRLVHRLENINVMHASPVCAHLARLCQAYGGQPSLSQSRLHFLTAGLPAVGLAKAGGPDRDQTDDLVIANDALYQLSYRPISERPY